MQPLFPAIEQYIAQLSIEAITEERKLILAPLVAFIRQKKEAREPILINFICTHNSRRSIFSQVWAQVMAHYYGVPQVTCFSGGTEATRIALPIIATLEAIGFRIEIDGPENNPLHHIMYADAIGPVPGFSKKYNDAFNPQRDFAAVMTCSEADAGCPMVQGSAVRIPITYADPKLFDGTPEAEQRYAERCQQIATEMKYIFSRLAN